MKLENDSILLREIRKDDLALLNKLINDPVINKTTVGDSKHVSMEEQLRWFENLKKSSDIRFIIANKNDEPLGTCIINQIDEKNHSCSIGIKLDQTAQGKGLGTQTIRLILPYIFDVLKMHRIFVEILESNIASIKLFEKCGFKIEGKHIDAVYKNGEYVNLLTLGLINERNR